MKKKLLTCFLAIIIGANVLLPLHAPSPDPSETVQPFNGLWDENKN